MLLYIAYNTGSDQKGHRKLWLDAVKKDEDPGVPI